MRKLVLVLLIAISVQAKDAIRVEVSAVHSVTHNGRSLQDYMLSGPGHPVRQIESYNLDAIINGERVILNCEDPRGCEAPAVGSYDAEIRHEKYVKLTFEMPLSKKSVTRMYKVAGTWQSAAPSDAK
jgi:hypothetical protein